MNTKIFIRLVSLLFLWVLATPNLHALGVEVSLGGTQQNPSGTVAYKGVALDLRNDLKYDNVNVIFGRVRLDLPLVPNVYLTASPLRFDATGSKDVTFTFGDRTFTGTVPFDSALKLDHYDLGLFYGVPFLKTLTRDKLNVDLGINARLIDFKAEISQPTTGLKESKSLVVPVPMGFAAFQFSPIKKISLEGEVRGIGYGSNRYIDAVGRLKFRFLKLGFVAGGYKYQNIRIDQSDVKTDLMFGGPTVELGIDF